MSGFRVVIDACVLVPIVKTDLLLNLAERGMFHPLWSQRILDEMRDAILDIRADLTAAAISRRIEAMNAIFEDALVDGWEPLESAIRGMPDPDDRHLVAAAIAGRAGLIVTDNVKDFPKAVLEQWNLTATTSDEFLLDALDLDAAAVIDSLVAMVAKRKQPPVTVDSILEGLSASGTTKFVSAVRGHLDA